MRKQRLRTGLCLVCALLLFAATPVQAAQIELGLTPDGEVNGIPYLVPGESATFYFTITNLNTLAREVYFRAEAAGLADFDGDSGKLALNQSLLAQIDVELVLHCPGNLHGTGRTLYAGKADYTQFKAGYSSILGQTLPLDLLARNEQAILEATVSVPPELDNHYEFAQGKFWWHFFAMAEDGGESSSSSSENGGGGSGGGNGSGSIGGAGNGGNSVTGTETTDGLRVVLSQARPTALSPGGQLLAAEDDPVGTTGATLVGDTARSTASIRFLPPVTAGWSLLNLILALLASITGLAAVAGMAVKGSWQLARARKNAQGERRNSISLAGRAVVLLWGLGAAILFLRTQNLQLPMLFADSWSVYFVGLLLLQLVTVLLAAHREGTLARRGTATTP